MKTIPEEVSIYQPINFEEKLNLINEHWIPKIIAQMNDYQLKLVKIQGDFTWHSHHETDEVFIVLQGSMQIDFRDGVVKLRPGEMFVVSKGVDHKPFAENECSLLLVEPLGTVNTGDAGGNMTAPSDVWI
jgi:mannose-6-phosphate isomerase-like protein (cupin superfamily)